MASRIALPQSKPPANVDLPPRLPGNLTRTEPLQEYEIQQASYQLAARATGNPIEDPSELQHLAAATKVMHQTRTDLKHGRGNVDIDIEASNGDSMARAKVSYALRFGAPETGGGVALAYGAGNCDQNALINARRYAAMLQNSDETVKSVGNAEIPHIWAELHRPDITLADNKTEPRSKIVLDSWAAGPAVRLEDSTWAPYSSVTKASFDSVKGKSAVEAMDRAKNHASAGGLLHERTESLLARFKLDPPSTDRIFSNVQVINAGFAYKAFEVLNAQSTLTREISAVAAARSAYGLSVREATARKTVDAVTFEAMNLDTQTRPPMVLATQPAV